MYTQTLTIMCKNILRTFGIEILKTFKNIQPQPREIDGHSYIKLKSVRIEKRSLCYFT